MSTSMEPKKLMSSLCAGEMWAVVDASPGAAHRLHGQAVILRRPSHHRVGGQRQTPRLLGLLFEVAGADGALVGVEQVSLQGVQRLALVQLPRGLPPVRRGSQLPGGMASRSY